MAQDPAVPSPAASPAAPPAQPPKTYRDYVREQALKWKVPEELAFEIVDRESKGIHDPGDGITTSTQGAQGFFQLLPSTAYGEFGLDPTKPRQNIEAGIRYLRQGLERNNFDSRLAAEYYHGGPDVKQHGPKTRAYGEAIVTGVRSRLDARKKGQAFPTVRVDVQQAGPTFPAAGTARTPSIRRGGSPESTYLSEKLAQERPRRSDFSWGGTPPTMGSPEDGHTLSTVGTPPPPPSPRQFEDIGAAFQISKPTLIGGGAGVGAYYGGQMGLPAGPLGAALGTTSGAIVGGTAGYVTDQLAQEAARQMNYLGQPPSRPTGYELAADAAEAGRSGAYAEAGGQVGGAIINKALAPFASKLAPHAQAAMARFRGSKGEPLTLPGEVSDSWFLNFLQNVSDYSLLGKGPGQALRAQRQREAERQVLDTLGDLDLPIMKDAERGAGVIADHTTAVKAFRVAEKARWQGTPEQPGFNRLAREIPAETPTLDDYAQALLGEKTVVPNLGQRLALAVARRTAPVGELGDTAADEAIKALSGSTAGPPPASFQEAIQQAIADPAQRTPLTAYDLRHIVSSLGRQVRNLQRAEKLPNASADATYQRSQVEQLWQRAKADLEDALFRTSPQAHRLYLEGVEFSKGGNAQLLNKYVKEVVRSRPEEVFTKMWGKRRSTFVNTVRAAVGEEAFRPMQAQGIEELLQRNAKTGEIDWPAVLKRMTEIGDDTLDAFFPGGHAETIRETATLMRDLGKKRWGDKGRYAVEASQIGGVGAILYFNGHPALYAAMTIPTVAAHVLSSRAGIRWLTTGLKAGPFAQATINANTRLAALLAEEGIETGRWEDPDDPNKAPRRVREMPSVLGQPPMPPPLSPRAPGERVEPPPPAAPSLYDRTIGRAGEAIAPSTRPTPYRDLVGRR